MASQNRSKPPARSGHSPEAICLIVPALTILTFVLYLPALKNGFLINWDDDVLVMNNQHLRSLGLQFISWALFDYKTDLWHPLTWFSHALDYAFWGMNPFGHHLTSIVLHTINTAIVSVLSIQLVNSAQKEGDGAGWPTIFAATVTGLLFGIHPVHVESVAWITERRDVLYAFFFLLSTICYLRYAKSLSVRGQSWQFMTCRSYQLSLFLFAFSLLSKPMAITLPWIHLLLDWYPLGRISERSDIVTLLKENIPFILLNLPVAAMTILAQKQVGGIRNIGESSLAMRFLVSIKSLIMYLFNIIWPQICFLSNFTRRILPSQSLDTLSVVLS